MGEIVSPWRQNQVCPEKRSGVNRRALTSNREELQTELLIPSRISSINRTARSMSTQFLSRLTLLLGKVRDRRGELLQVLFRQTIAAFPQPRARAPADQAAGEPVPAVISLSAPPRTSFPSHQRPGAPLLDLLLYASVRLVLGSP